jgi:large subunit ribosomal protein L9
MKVILLKDVKGLGNVHDVVEVKDGYAKNYLFKNKLAVANTPLAQSALKQDLDVLASQEAAKLADANVLKSKLDKITLEFKLKINLGNVFGSISHKMIIDEL